jgi:hypothetical protein
MITYKSGHNDCPPSWEVFWRDMELFLRNSGIIDNREPYPPEKALSKAPKVKP